jgi:hypothetical protein
VDPEQPEPTTLCVCGGKAKNMPGHTCAGVEWTEWTGTTTLPTTAGNYYLTANVTLSEQTVTWYAGQEVLRESAVTATRRPIAGGWGFGGENSLPVEACALALWGAKTCKRNPGKKMRIG